MLLGAGALSLLLASHALAAGPLAASQPGFTILDPLAASLLGLFLFGEHFQADRGDLAVEALALALLVAGVTALSHSHLIDGEDDTRTAAEAAAGAPAPRAIGGPAADFAGNGDASGDPRGGGYRSARLAATPSPQDAGDDRDAVGDLRRTCWRRSRAQAQAAPVAGGASTAAASSHRARARQRRDRRPTGPIAGR